MTTFPTSTPSLSPVPFHGHTLFVTEVNGQPYTPMKPIVEGMGLAWQAQHAKLKSRAERWGITMIVIPSQGGEQTTLCLPLRKLPGWLMTINPSKVAPKLRPQVVLYQNECDDALWDFWTKGQATNKRMAHTEPKPKPRPRPEAMPTEEPERVRVFHTPAHDLRTAYKQNQKSSASQRSRVNKMIETIDKKLTPTGIYLGRQLIAKMVASQFGIDTICDVIPDDIPILEHYLEDVIFNLNDAGPVEAPKLNASRPIPAFRRLEPCGDTVKDYADEIMVSIEKAGRAFEDFLTQAKRDAEARVSDKVLAQISGLEMNGIEKDLLRQSVGDLNHAYREQTFTMMVAGNAVRHTLNSMVRLSEMVDAKVRYASKTALPAGRGRPRAALPR